jgi:hypothetical protein
MDHIRYTYFVWSEMDLLSSALGLDAEADRKATERLSLNRRC